MQCDVCKAELRAGDEVFIVTTAVIDNPDVYLGVSQIGIGPGNAVVHRSCLDLESAIAAPCLVEAPATIEESGTVQRTAVLDGIEV